MGDKIIKVRMSGELVLKVLENGVSMYPKYDGRWPLVSGISFKFDPNLEAGKRIIADSVVLDNGDALDPDKKYTLATKFFLLHGKDGYDAFLDPSLEKLCDPDEYATLP